MSTIIHIVATNFKDQHGSQAWFWDRDEARENYSRRIEDVGDTHAVKLYRLDVTDAMDEIVAEAISNDAAELMDSHEPEDEAAVWGELEFRPEGYFYIERTKAPTSEYWPFRVEFIEDHKDSYVVIDHTTDTTIGVIVTSYSTHAFKASVNGYEADQPFTSLKGAVIHIATEYNGI